MLLVLQRRASELRKETRLDNKRIAFINAAEAMLDREMFVEIWHRAAETEPEAFEGWGGVPA